MNAHVIDVFDEIVFALFKARNLFSDAMLKATVNRHPMQQPALMSFAYRSVRPERFDLGVLNIAAQNVT